MLRTECACPGVCGSGGGPSDSHHSSSSKIGITGLVIISVYACVVAVIIDEH